MPNYAGFLQLRRALFEHLRDGRLSHLEALAFIFIACQADSRSGVWIGSGGALAGDLGVPHRTAAHLLEELSKGGYLRRFPKPGSRYCYPILVNRYLVTSGEHAGELLNAAASKDSDSLVYEKNGRSWELQGEESGKQLAGQVEKIIERRGKPKPIPRRSTLGGEGGDDGFSEFYGIYPRKQDQKRAESAWRRLSRSDRAAAIEALPRLKASEQWLREQGRFVPMPSTYLNGRRWQDSILESNDVHGGDRGAGGENRKQTAAVAGQAGKYSGIGPDVAED